MPAQAKANKLDLEDTPVELSDVNALEQWLTSLWTPFMKMVAPPVANSELPTDMTHVCTLLPRLPCKPCMPKQDT